MAVLAFSTSHREIDGEPVIPAVNVYWNPSVGSFFDRPALREYQTKGSGRIRAMFYEDGLFNGDRFYWSGSQLWRENAIIGTIGGEDTARVDGGKDGADDCLVYTVDGGRVYKYVNGVVTSIAMPDDRPVYGVRYFGSRWLYFTGDGRFYWSDVNDPSTIDTLNFATAEAAFDGFRAAVDAGGYLYIFGSSSTETWYATGNTDDATLAYAPVASNRLQIGAFSADSVFERDGRVYFISNTRNVFLLAGGLNPIADDSVLEALSTAALEEISLSTIYVSGKEFFMLTDRATDTYVFDGREWYRWRRVKKESLNIMGTLVKDGVTYAGDMANGKVYRFDVTVRADSDYHIERVVGVYAPATSGRERCNTVSLQAARGVGELETVADPQVELRYSDDGHQYEDWMGESLGPVGRYDYRPTWRSLGLIQPFGRFYQLRCAENVAFRPKALVVNEERP